MSTGEKRLTGDRRHTRSPARAAALVAALALIACADGGSSDGAAKRLPSDRGGQAMIRLPAASTAVDEPTAAEHRSPPRRPARPRPASIASPDDTGDDRDERADDDDDGDEAGDRNARAVPEGTPPQIARVFRRLPLSIHDGPPLAGIGQSGVHVDRIWLGSRAGKNGCIGKSDGFSIAGGDEVNVCFRVVHGRVEEDVDVIWEKDGDLAQRRRGITIPPLHAYRSRSYLVLRGEYVGAWKVRILSSDQVELASATFSVVE